jgi:hypothetical protein
MTESTQYGELADDLENRVDTLGQESEKLGERIDAAREEAKRTRAETPGTPDWDDPDEDEDEDSDDEEDDEDDSEDDDA